MDICCLVVVVVKLLRQTACVSPDCCLQISRCTCGCRLRCGPVAHQQHGSVTTDKLSEDENDVTGVHYGRFCLS